MLCIEKLYKSFNNDPVFTGFSYSFENNGIYRLEGPNGAGKTTLLKMIRGIVTQDSGLITLGCGTPLAKCTTYIDANNRSFLHRLTVKENLAYFLALNKQPQDIAMINSLLEEFNATHLLDKVFSLLSVGQMQLIALIRGLLEQPKLLLIDEALTNIDQQRIESIAGHLEAFANDSDRIVIICSHASLPVKISATVQLG
jgi:ABC-type multidrug transport system ATPase subunit